jgi:putative hemolysin
VQRKTLLYALAVVVVAAIVVVLVFVGPTIAATPSPTPTPQYSIANPASVYCAERGYQLAIRNTADGQAGHCVFPDKSECEEWAFFRGQCGVGRQTRAK